MMLQGAGFEVTDLGSDVAPEKFVDAVKTSGANPWWPCPRIADDYHGQYANDD